MTWDEYRAFLLRLRLDAEREVPPLERLAWALEDVTAATLEMSRTIVEVLNPAVEQMVRTFGSAST